MPGEEKRCTGEGSTAAPSPPNAPGEEVINTEMKLPSGTRCSQPFLPPFHPLPTCTFQPPQPEPRPQAPSRHSSVLARQPLLGTQVPSLISRVPPARPAPDPTTRPTSTLCQSPGGTAGVRPRGCRFTGDWQPLPGTGEPPSAVWPGGVWFLSFGL